MCIPISWTPPALQKSREVPSCIKCISISKEQQTQHYKTNKQTPKLQDLQYYSIPSKPFQGPRNFVTVGKFKTKRKYNMISWSPSHPSSTFLAKAAEEQPPGKTISCRSPCLKCIKLPNLSKGPAVKHRGILSACVSAWEESSHWPHIALMPARDQQGNAPTTTKTKGLSSYLFGLYNMKTSPTF